MARSREEAKRLDRLAGSGKGWGGGLPLPLLFAAILNELLDHGPANDERLVEIASSTLEFKTNQVMSTWPSGWASFTSDVLAQMESSRMIRRDESGWVTGEDFLTGHPLTIIPARRGSKADGVTVWEAEERDALSRADHIEHEVTSTVGGLWPDGNGLRPVDHSRVARIRESEPEVGQLYPVLVDQHGRILDGKHRKAANPDWREYKIPVESDEMALAVALWANDGVPLEPEIRKRVEELILGAKTAQEKQRERIRQALLDNPELAHNAIAKRLGLGNSGHVTVGRECRELIVQCTIRECGHRLTESGKAAPGPKPKQSKQSEIKPTEAEKRFIIANAKQLGGSMDSADLGRQLGWLTTGHSSSALKSVIDEERGRRKEQERQDALVRREAETTSAVKVAPGTASEKHDEVQEESVVQRPAPLEPEPPAPKLLPAVKELQDLVVDLFTALSGDEQAQFMYELPLFMQELNVARK